MTDKKTISITTRSDDFNQAKQIAAVISDAMTEIGLGFVSASTVNEVDGVRAITMRWSTNRQTLRQICTMTDDKQTTKTWGILASVMARMDPTELDAQLRTAADLVRSEDPDAVLILDGMRAGIKQAQEAGNGHRVLAIWFDADGGRMTLHWPGDEPAGKTLQQTVNAALKNAFEGERKDEDR